MHPYPQLTASCFLLRIGKAGPLQLQTFSEGTVYRNPRGMYHTAGHGLPEWQAGGGEHLSRIQILYHQKLSALRCHGIIDPGGQAAAMAVVPVGKQQPAFTAQGAKARAAQVIAPWSRCIPVRGEADHIGAFVGQETSVTIEKVKHLRRQFRGRLGWARRQRCGRYGNAQAIQLLPDGAQPVVQGKAGGGMQQGVPLRSQGGLVHDGHAFSP